jgi:geranylgeranyl pyrophosphate synthase
MKLVIQSVFSIYIMDDKLETPMRYAWRMIVNNYMILQKLLEPIRYILQVPGKQIRAKLAQAFNYWLKISDDRVQEIDEIINMLHNASIL